MLTLERQLSILEYLKHHHCVSVAELSQIFYISQTSIRRDLDKLEGLGLIRKTYGGAVLVQGNNEVISLEARSKIGKEAKSVIAKRAITLLHDNDVIFMDSSSTVLAMAPYLGQVGHVSVITNGLMLASALAEYPNCNLYVLGGYVTPHTHSMHSSTAFRMVDEVHADYLFFSPKAVDNDGNIYCADADEANIRRHMMRKCEHTVMLCDHNKLEHYASFKLCTIRDISTMISEVIPSPEFSKQLQDNGVNIMI